MQIDLKPQLIPLDLNGLQSYAGEQKARLSKLNTLIADATTRIERVRKAVAPPPKDMTGAERQIIQNVNQRQLTSEILAIRRDADSAMIDIIRATQSAARAAKDMGERHWDIWSVLRRVKTGNGDVAGIVEASFTVRFSTPGPYSGFSSQIIGTPGFRLVHCWFSHFSPPR